MEDLNINIEIVIYLVIGALWLMSFLFSKLNKKSEEAAEGKTDSRAISEARSFIDSLQAELPPEKLRHKAEETTGIKREPYRAEQKESSQAVESEVFGEEEIEQNILEDITSSESRLVAGFIFHEILGVPKSKR
jgi:hypothetical protein